MLEIQKLLWLLDPMEKFIALIPGKISESLKRWHLEENAIGHTGSYFPSVLSVDLSFPELELPFAGCVAAYTWFKGIIGKICFLSP